jgi:hypothetical protein
LWPLIYSCKALIYGEHFPIQKVPKAKGNLLIQKHFLTGMKTILTSISLLITSILLVIGCEVLDKTIHEENRLETEAIYENSELDEAESQQVNIELTEIELNNKETLQKTDDS